MKAIRRRARRAVAAFTLLAALFSAPALAASAPHPGALVALPVAVAAHQALSSRAALTVLAPLHHRAGTPGPRPSAAHSGRSLASGTAGMLAALASAPLAWLTPTLTTALAAALCGWLLAFVRRSSRTRGQPCTDALAL